MFDLLNLPGVKPVDLRTERGSITIVADVIEGEPPICPDCNRPLYKHGKRTNLFADTPLQMQPVRLEVNRIRYRCDACGKTVTHELEFLDERRRATKRLVDAIRSRCLGTTFHALAQQTGLAVNTIKNIALDLIDDLEGSVHYETPVIMGIDELNLAGGFRCIITNLATNNVFQILEQRTQAHMKPFFETLPDREKVEWVCTDMWRPFKQSFGPFFPNAQLVIDKFHVVRMASDALDHERKKYQAELSREDRIKVKKSIRWLTLKRPGSLSQAEQSALLIVRAKMPDLALAYDLKEGFYCIYDCDDKGTAISRFQNWKGALPADGYEQFHKLAKTVENHFDDIFAYWDCPHRITNAYTECLNGMVKLANRMGRGYSYEIIRAKTLYEKAARNVGRAVIPRSMAKKDPTTKPTLSVEYGPHIPTLVELAESGELD